MRVDCRTPIFRISVPSVRRSQSRTECHLPLASQHTVAAHLCLHHHRNATIEILTFTNIIPTHLHATASPATTKSAFNGHSDIAHSEGCQLVWEIRNRILRHHTVVFPKSARSYCETRTVVRPPMNIEFLLYIRYTVFWVISHASSAWISTRMPTRTCHAACIAYTVHASQNGTSTMHVHTHLSCSHGARVRVHSAGARTAALP